MTYTIEILPSGHRFTAQQGETVLDAAVRHGLILPYGCRGGSCGTCAAKLVSGTVSYDDECPALQEQSADVALLCQARPASDLRIVVEEIQQAQELVVKQLPCKVARKEPLSHDVMRLLLKLPEAQRLPFFAGQYLDVLTSDGKRRSFSIANAPHDDEFLELHIRHVEGGEFTHYVFHELKERSIWRIEAPLGSFFLREDSERPIIFMGGGTGFAPLKGMIEQALHAGIQRPMHLFWGVRALRDLYLADLPAEWQRRHGNFRFTPVLSDPTADDGWGGETGWVHEAVVRAYPDLNGHDLYMSGPPVMIEAARLAFLQHGLPEDRMFSDAFEFNRVSAKSSGAAA